MTDDQVAGASGGAADAEVQVIEASDVAVVTLNEEDVRRAAEDYARLSDHVEKAREKVTKQEAHLEEAKTGLANAEAELAAATEPVAPAEGA